MRTLDAIAAEILTAHASCIRSLKVSSNRAREVGRLLIEAKAQLKHGEWIPWLATNCPDISIRVAQGYMCLARRPKREDLSYLAVRDDVTTLMDEWRPSADELDGSGEKDEDEDDHSDEEDEDDHSDTGIRMRRLFFTVAEAVEYDALVGALAKENESRAHTLLETLRLVFAARRQSEAA